MIGSRAEVFGHALARATIYNVVAVSASYFGFIMLMRRARHDGR